MVLLRFGELTFILKVTVCGCLHCVALKVLLR
jgi:hypothetical protein